MRIETNRTIIREFTLEDAQAVLRFNNYPLVTRYTGDADMVNTLADAKKVISTIWLTEYEQYGYGRWAVINKIDHQVMGFCGLKFNPELGLPDIGYRFLPQYWQQGYATETATACLRYCQTQLNINDVFADIMPDNKGSIRVIEKLGFELSELIEFEGCQYLRYRKRQGE